MCARRVAPLELKRTTAALAVLMAAACVPPRAAVVPADRALLSVVSWNMDAGRGNLPQLVADLESGQVTGRRMPHTVLLLQEAVQGGVHDVDALAASRGWSAFFAPVRSLEGRTIGNAILSSVPLADARAVPLPRERQPRAAAVASIRLLSESLFVVSVHLENRASWWKGGPLSAASRERQAQALLRALPAGAPGILGGDLNTWLGTQEPAWRALAERFDETPPAPEPTFHDRAVLDHLFFDLPSGWRGVRMVLHDRFGSDHHPVLGIVAAPAWTAR